MKYCNKCILPDTRPGVMIGSDGICLACQNATSKGSIDWGKREADFSYVVSCAKKKSKGYDCVIPVSGGKDSTWQVIKCLEYGLNPLAVTWKTPARTEIGQKNLDNLVALGVDHIDYQINPCVEKTFMIKALRRYGSTAIPMHLALFNIPLNIASRFDIPLIVWGENSAFEYGTDEESLMGFELNSQWLEKFGVAHGTTAKDWIDSELTQQMLTPYFGPSDDLLDTKGIRAVFLGYYFNWDPKMTFEVASRHGFKSRKEGAKTGYYEFADIDDDFISIHHYLKWYKFGITRVFDNLSIEIRNNRISRQEALRIAKTQGAKPPMADIKRFCAFVDITTKEFFEIIEKFRNRDVWYFDNGVWKIRDFIIEDWQWDSL